MKLPEILQNSIQNAVNLIVEKHSQVSTERSFLIAISGIDGSGKGVVASEICHLLQSQGLKVALIGLDVWHNPQTIRFNTQNPAQHFYNHAFRWEELFDLLIKPLKYQKRIDLTTHLLDLKTDKFYQYTYNFEEIDIIIFEGIFILQKLLIKEYDYKIWIECSFETALQRALLRGQEGLSEEQTIYDYQTIYFPAQRVHFEQDNPQSLASLIINNDF